MKKSLIILIILVSTIMVQARIVDTVYSVGSGMVNDSVYGLVLKHKIVNDLSQSSKIDTIFSIDYEEKVKVYEAKVPYSVYNAEATIKQNYYALNGMEVDLADINHYNYSGLYRSLTVEKTFLKFDEEQGKNVVLQNYLSYPLEFAFEFFFVFIVSFFTMFLLQRMVVKEKYFDKKESTLTGIFVFNFVLFGISYIFTKSYMGEVVTILTASVCLSLILAYLLTLFFPNISLKNVLVRDSIIILLLIIFFTVILFLKDYSLRLVGVFCFGIAFGGPSIFFWKWKNKRKDLRLTEKAHEINKKG